MYTDIKNGLRKLTTVFKMKKPYTRSKQRIGLFRNDTYILSQ